MLASPGRAKPLSPSNTAAHAPKLADSLPAHLRKKLESRTPARGSPRDSGKENGDSPRAAPAIRASPKIAASPSTPKIGASPSKAVLEIQRLAAAREERRAHTAARRQHREENPGRESQDFRAMIEAYQQNELAAATVPAVAASGDERLRVCVRKRPLLPSELEAGAFDVISCAGRTCVLHETRRRVDLSRTLENHAHAFDALFDAAADNAAVYDATARPLLDVVFGGGRATVIAYGQTGSGKSYTMMGAAATAPEAEEDEEGDVFYEGGSDGVAGVYGLAARELYEGLAARPGLVLGVSMFEIYRESAFDLLGVPEEEGGGGAGAKLPVLEDARGEVQVVGLAERRPADEVEVLQLLDEANASRKTANNTVNEHSSRSHAVMQMVVRDGATGAEHGKLTLVDLAGSERAADTGDADRDTRAEGADINKSLLCLKECIRAIDSGGAAGAHVPFRGSKLTQVLRESFAAPSSRTVVIAHVAPSSKSCDYSLNSLRYAARLKAAASSMAVAPPSSSDRRAMARPPPSPGRPPPSPGGRFGGAARRNGFGPSPAKGAASFRPAAVEPRARQRLALGEDTTVEVVEAAAAAEAEGEGGGGSESERAAAVLGEVLRCLHDPSLWEKEGTEMERACATMEGAAAYAEHLDTLLADRAALFEKLRAHLAPFRAKIAEKAEGKKAEEK